MTHRPATHPLGTWHKLISRTAWGTARIVDAIRSLWYRIADGMIGGWGWLAEHTTAPDGRGIAIGAAALIALLSLVLATTVIAIGRYGSEPVDRARVATTSGTEAGAEPKDTTAQKETPPGDQLPGVNVHVNEDAGYLFSYPDGWDLSTSGTETAVLSPDGEVMIWFDVAPSGSLSRASDQIVRDVTAGLDDVRLVSDEVGRTPQGERSLVIGGEATDATGAPITFLAITIQGADENRAIVIHLGEGSEPADALPGIRDIVSSFRTSRPV